MPVNVDPGLKIVHVLPDPALGSGGPVDAAGVRLRGKSAEAHLERRCGLWRGPARSCLWDDATVAS